MSTTRQDEVLGGPFHSGAEFTWPMRNRLLYSAPFRSIKRRAAPEPSFSTQLVSSVALGGRAARRRGSRRRDAAAGVGGAGPAG